MYDGTLGMKGPWQALVTFQQMVILADKSGVVDMTAEALSRRTTIPVDIIQLGITALEAPDPQSRTPDEDGRRITRLSDGRDWGWQITNYEKYRKIRTADERREYQRQYWHTRKGKLNNSTETQPTQPIAVSSKQRQKVEVEATTSLDGFDQAWALYPKRAGANNRADARKAWEARRRSGVDPSEMIQGIVRYASFIRATGKEGTEYVKQAATFFGPSEHWKYEWPVPDKPHANGKPMAGGGARNDAVIDATLDFLEAKYGK
jgi:hypothetical protein